MPTGATKVAQKPVVSTSVFLLWRIIRYVTMSTLPLSTILKSLYLGDMGINNFVSLSAL